MKARSDTLNLRWRTWGSDEEKMCLLCRNHVETLEHFLIDCDALQEIRNKKIEFQRPVQMDKREDLMMRFLLLRGEDEKREEFVDLLEGLWRERRKITERNQAMASV